MPISDQNQGWLMKLINLAGASLFPLSLSLLLPVFMYSIVLEKEERLIEMMKMNGLKMRNYWFVNYLYSFALYLIMVAIFFGFGFGGLRLSFFTETDSGILVPNYHNLMFLIDFIKGFDDGRMGVQPGFNGFFLPGFHFEGENFDKSLKFLIIFP